MGEITKEIVIANIITDAIPLVIGLALLVVSLIMRLLIYIIKKRRK